MRRNLCYAVAVLGLASFTPLAAAAQTANIGPERSTADPGRLIINVPVPAGGRGEQTINLDYAGDLDLSIETIDVRVDGTSVGTLVGGTQCVTSFSATLTIPDAVYTAAAADGVLELAFLGAPQVDDLCTNSFAAPFTAFNDGIASSIVVQGTVTVSQPPAPPPGIAIEDIPEAQQETVAAARGGLILPNGPERRRRIEQLTGEVVSSRTISFHGIPLIENAPVDLAVTQNALNFGGALTQGRLAFWTEGVVLGIDDAVSDDQTFRILHAGIDARVGDRLLLGLGVQIDRMDMTDTRSGDVFDARGWMVGPLLTYRLAENLFFDARLAYGEISTDVSRGGGDQTDAYDSERALVQLALTGDVDWAGFVIAPEAELGWYRETAGAYTSEVLGRVDETETTVQQAVLGVEVSRPFRHGNGQIEPFIGVSAINANISTGTVFPGSYADALDGWSGQATLGVGFVAPNGMSWSVEGNLGGLGTDVESIGGRIALYIPF